MPRKNGRLSGMQAMAARSISRCDSLCGPSTAVTGQICGVGLEHGDDVPQACECDPSSSIIEGIKGLNRASLGDAADLYP